MRIVELVNTLEVGGVERMVANLAEALRKRGHDLSVVCLRKSGALSQPLEEAGIEILALGKEDGFSFSTVRRLAAYLKEKRVDVVHTHNPLVHHYGVFAGRMAGIPGIISTVHGLNNLEKFGKAELLYALSCVMTDRVVSVCETAREFFSKNPLLPGRKLAVIYNGIPLERFCEVRSRPVDEQFVFGCVARLVPIKDHRTLLTAFAALLKKHPECRLEILGDGPLRRELQKYATELGETVRFHGESLDVCDFFARWDAFVLSSVSEGLPLTIIEAMAAGLPIVATAVGGIPELIRDGACGWLSPPSQPDKLAEVMRNAVESPDRAAMGARGRNYVTQHYSVAQMAEQYEALFHRVLKRHRIAKA